MLEDSNIRDIGENMRYEDIKIGQRVSFCIEVTEQSLNEFSVLCGDFNPLHMDSAFARLRGFPNRVVHGMLAASFFSRLVGMYLPGRNAFYLSQKLEFLKPIFPGDLLEVVGIVTKKSDSLRTITIQTDIYNKYKEKMISGTAKVMFTHEIKKINIYEGGNMNINLSGKVAVITGSSRGIGAVTALTLSRLKAAVVINYNKSRNKAEELLNEIKKTKGQAIIMKADISKKNEAEAMFQAALKAFKRIDILVNNATIPIYPKSFDKLEWEDMQAHIDIQIKGTFNCCKAVLPLMLQHNKGKIINLITTYAVGVPPADLAHYVTAKSGLLGLSRSLAVEYGPKGINVNMVSPGIANTELSAHVSERMKKVIAMQTPLRRITEPQDVANVIAFLASDASDFISGANHLICGGQVMC